MIIFEIELANKNKLEKNRFEISNFCKETRLRWCLVYKSVKTLILTDKKKSKGYFKSIDAR